MSSQIHGTLEAKSLEDIRKVIIQLKNDLPRSPDKRSPKILFRGQKNADWNLTTTLERTGHINQIDIVDYYRLAYSVFSKVGSTGDKPINIASIEQVESSLHSAYDLGATGLPALDYLAYLRHHGFPSPLLDWTKCLYIAAFFAFNEPSFTGDRSIYAFCEFPNWKKGTCQTEPSIIGLGHETCQVERHVKQMAEYTVCVSLYGPKDYWSFSEHQAVLAFTERDQDSLMRFVIPGHQADAVRAELAARKSRFEALLSPTELDCRMKRLTQEVFGPTGPARSLKMR